jgi:hypothetical protein
MYSFRAGEDLRQLRCLRKACNKDALLGQSILIKKKITTTRQTGGLL